MSAEDRRSHILDAVVPLLMKHGADVTTRQIAEAADIAEGTIFRAFTDKDELIDQAVMRFMDPEVTFALIEDIDPALPVQDKVSEVVDIFRRRSEGMVGMMSAVGHRKRLHANHEEVHARADVRGAEVFTRLFAADEDALRIDRSLAALFMRVLGYGASIPFFTSQRDVTTDEIVDFVMRGILKEGN